MADNSAAAINEEMSNKIAPLNIFGWNWLSWVFHTNKARIIATIMLTAMIVILVYIIRILVIDKCSDDKSNLYILTAVEMCIGIVYIVCIHKHVKWPFLRRTRSEFTGIRTIERQRKAYAAAKVRSIQNQTTAPIDIQPQMPLNTAAGIITSELTPTTSTELTRFTRSIS